MVEALFDLVWFGLVDRGAAARTEKGAHGHSCVGAKALYTIGKIAEIDLLVCHSTLPSIRQ